MKLIQKWKDESEEIERTEKKYYDSLSPDDKKLYDEATIIEDESKRKWLNGEQSYILLWKAKPKNNIF